MEMPSSARDATRPSPRRGRRTPLCGQAIHGRPSPAPPSARPAVSWLQGKAGRPKDTPPAIAGSLAGASLSSCAPNSGSRRSRSKRISVRNHARDNSRRSIDCSIAAIAPASSPTAAASVARAKALACDGGAPTRRIARSGSPSQASISALTEAKSGKRPQSRPISATSSRAVFERPSKAWASAE
jgi:hypothetical protein